jgi:hypothetical protein
MINSQLHPLHTGKLKIKYEFTQLTIITELARTNEEKQFLE